MGLQPSGPGDKGTSGLRHHRQLAIPIRQGRRESIHGSLVVISEGRGILGRDTGPPSTYIGKLHLDTKLSFDTVEYIPEELGKLNKRVFGEVLSAGMARKANKSEAITFSFLDDPERYFCVDTKVGGERLVRSFAGRDESTKGLEFGKDSGHVSISKLCNLASGLKYMINLREAVDGIILDQ
ncbi:hypothetical protein IWW34DRAFT_811364 [Fusarium oxysporum f. sp. albedinis]|nr:hypothetical protein IWW34DRAFT_811364 [Fusarium oxysporum f. sp. albedinis]